VLGGAIEEAVLDDMEFLTQTKVRFVILEMFTQRGKCPIECIAAEAEQIEPNVDIVFQLRKLEDRGWIEGNSWQWSTTPKFRQAVIKMQNAFNHFRRDAVPA